MTEPTFRIAAYQAPAAKAKQAAMIAANELGIFTYFWPVQLADAEQRDSLRRLLAEQYGSEIPMPADTTGVFLFIELDGVPALIPENDAPAFVLGVVLGKRGLDAARRVTYRPEMLPAPQE